MLNYGNLHTKREVFTPEECKQLIEDTEKQYKYLVAQIDEKKAIAPNIRRSEIIWIKERYLYNKIGTAMTEINEKDYGFKLTYCEPIQFTRYLREGHYDWHNDGVKFRDVSDKRKNLVRKLSCTVLLNDEFTGGKLVFKDPLEPSNQDHVAEINVGDMIVFPSYNLHKVEPVTTGRRFALVAWFNGPPWT